MKKNGLGFAGLFCGLASLILTGVALCLRTGKIEGSSVSLYGSVNIYLCFGAAALGLIALVLGILAVRHRDRKGPRKAGIIIGIIAIIIAMGSAGICGVVSSVVDYANGKPNTIFSKVDGETRQQLDELVEKIKTEYPEK